MAKEGRKGDGGEGEERMGERGMEGRPSALLTLYSRRSGPLGSGSGPQKSRGAHAFRHSQLDLVKDESHWRIRGTNGIVNWSGQDLNLGFSVVPLRAFPMVVVPAVLDGTGRAGDGARFGISAAIGYDLRR